MTPSKDGPPGRTKRVRQRKSDPAAKTRLLDAAVEAILEAGYYRATSNEIAPRAGVTWGTIQYHFSSREGLLLGVVERDYQYFLHTLASTDIGDGTLRDRLSKLFDAVLAFYGRPDYVATLQIRLNLLREPQGADITAQTLERQSEHLHAGWRALIGAALGPESADSDLGWFIFEMFRSLATRVAIMQQYPAAVLSESRLTHATFRDWALDSVLHLVERSGASAAEGD